MSKEIVVNSDNGEVRAAILEDGKLVDLFIERSVHPRYAGNIYKGVVENVLPGMQAAFVDIGLERNAFLYVDDALAGRNGRNSRVVREADGEEIPVPRKKSRSIKDILKPGQEIMVQVTKEPIGTKGARVVTDITLPGRYVVLMPTVDYVGVSRRIDEDGERERLRKIAQTSKPRRMGVIVRTVAEGKSQEEIAADIQFLVKLWRRIQGRNRRAKGSTLLHQDYDLAFRLVRDHFAEDVAKFLVDDAKEHRKVLDLSKMFSGPMKDRIHLYTGQQPIFDFYGLEEEIARTLRRKVWLSCGGYLVIDNTEALTAIDVNTGKYTGSTCLADTVLKTNIEAAEEIARQLRLRNIGGIIVIDFIDMEDEAHQRQVVDKLEEALSRDKTKATVLGFTQLGLVEMTRKKVQQGLAESMTKVCPTCDGRGRILSEETLSFRAMRAIKKEALSTDQPAMLVLLHPSVAAMLIGAGGSNLSSLEEETGKVIYVKGSFDQKVEDIVIAAVGSREDVEKKALPVASGDRLDVVIEEPHVSNSRDGIARLEGYVIDIEGAGRLIGERVRIEVTKVFKTYARAKMVKEIFEGDGDDEPQADPLPSETVSERANQEKQSQKNAEKNVDEGKRSGAQKGRQNGGQNADGKPKQQKQQKQQNGRQNNRQNNGQKNRPNGGQKGGQKGRQNGGQKRPQDSGRKGQQNVGQKQKSEQNDANMRTNRGDNKAASNSVEESGKESDSKTGSKAGNKVRGRASGKTRRRPRRRSGAKVKGKAVSNASEKQTAKQG